MTSKRKQEQSKRHAARKAQKQAAQVAERPHASRYAQKRRGEIVPTQDLARRPSWFIRHGWDRRAQAVVRRLEEFEREGAT